jgi:prepilin-type N-terminal cleavage/methylation domain-containing protein
MRGEFFMTLKRLKSVGGFTLVEVMVTVVILLVAVIGTSGYRYYAALDAKKADRQVTAARTALLLCESWRAASDPNLFDPEEKFESQLTISPSSNYGPDVAEGFTELGNYEIIINGISYNTTLSWRNVSSGLRALNVTVGWDQGGSEYQYPNKSFKLTTYIDN